MQQVNGVMLGLVAVLGKDLRRLQLGFIPTQQPHHPFLRVGQIGGHGVGLEFHEDPWVGYIGKRGTGMLLVPGMMFTIEPMVNMGKPDVYTDGGDNWAVYTADGKPSAQWEIQVLVTEEGHEVLCW